jgi:hypothetical protein
MQSWEVTIRTVRFDTKQKGQRKYTAKFKRVRVTIVAVEKQ